MSTSRIPAAALRAVARRAQLRTPRRLGCRGLVTSIVITVPAAVWLLTSGPKEADAHSHSPSDHHSAPAPTEPNHPAAAEQSPQQPESAEANPSAAQTGQQVAPAPSDSSSPATDHEDTRLATSGSDMPSEKTAAENPREDSPKGEGEGEGEGAQKGGPAAPAADGGDEDGDGGKDGKGGDSSSS
ncbi:hypothetical protein AAE478_004988 [Parahypoxylon ruwenzoriense]